MPWDLNCHDMSIGMKAHLMGLIRQGISPTQVMAHHKAYVKEKALNNEHVSHDTFVLPSNIKNLAKKKTNELWQKHPKDPINVRMSILENLDLVFYYVQHATLDLNLLNQDDTPFTFKIQTPWQFEMMENFGNQSSISFNVTFGMN
jgi:hypothetical protein